MHACTVASLIKAMQLPGTFLWGPHGAVPGLCRAASTQGLDPSIIPNEKKKVGASLDTIQGAAFWRLSTKESAKRDCAREKGQRVPTTGGAKPARQKTKKKSKTVDDCNWTEKEPNSDKGASDNREWSRTQHPRV